MSIYVVKPGDTLSAIANRLGISNWRTLYDANKALIGSNPNLIRSGQQLSYGSTPAVTPVAPVSNATTLGTEAGAAQPINFASVLPWEQYFAPELAQGSAEQVYANYYAPIVQQAQGELETNFANRGLTRSGIRGQNLGDLYRKYGSEQQAGIEADVMQQQQMAREDYSRLQDLYESSSGKQKPTQTTYTPYKVAKPTTSAGTYGSSYLDWLNKATRV